MDTIALENYFFFIFRNRENYMTEEKKRCDGFELGVALYSYFLKVTTFCSIKKTH
jgi:hypothetical protein